MQAELDGRQGDGVMDAQGLAVTAGLGAQELGARGQTVGQLALRVGQVPAAPPTARVRINPGTVKPCTAPNFTTSSSPRPQPHLLEAGQEALIMIIM
ncbi:hypothetical protein [Streptomyces cinereoruber]|uniref:hypothetical protein n=1 Tax=Streptomyces cinereoruber TaxID=67260 RepID=UPI00363A4555